MSKIIKIMFVLIVLSGMMFTTLADRGISGKNRSKITLNLNLTSGIRNSISINLKSGVKYTGSLLTKEQQSLNNNNGFNFNNNFLVTYQKGNTVYIIPHKYITIAPDIKQGYTGMQLIIKSH